MNNSFQVTGGTNHVTQLNNLNDGVHRFYVKCSDPSGNTNTDYLIQIIVDQLPSARIILSSSSPLKVGIVEVKVIPSEELQAPPILEYSYNFSTKTRISLSESGQVWLGEFIILNSDNNKIGEFYFTGVDLTGNTGTKITYGNSFRIDTQPPSIIELFTAKSDDSRYVNLKWLSLDTDVDYYKIYRSNKPEVTNLDFLTKTSNNMFTDRTAEIGKKYYYKVSAVDEAGNEGDLSDEVELLTGNSGELELSMLNDESGAYLEVLNLNKSKNEREESMKEIDSMLSSFNDMLEKISEIRSDLKEDETKSKLSFLDESLRNNKTEILNLQKQLNSLKVTDSNVDITGNVTSIKKKVEELKSNIPMSIKLEEPKSVENQLTDQDIHLLLKDVLEAKKITKEESEIDKYEKFLKEVNAKFAVNTKFVAITINYLDGTEKKAILITKELSTKEKDKNTRYSAIEYIPKDAIKNSQDLYIDNKIKILSKNSLLEVDIDTDNYQYYYIIVSEIKLENMSEIKTLILADLNKFTIGTLNTGLITGFSISNVTDKTGNNSLLYVGVLIIIVIFLFVKFKKTKSRGIKNKKSIAEHFNSSLDHVLDLVLGPKKDKRVQTTEPRKYVKPTSQSSHPHQGGKIKEEADSYKPFISENLYVAGFFEPEDSDTKLLMSETEIAINNLDLDSAVKLYKKAHLKYKPEDADKQACNFMKRLHSKISILIKLEQINGALTNNDDLMLKHLLTNLEKQYSDIIKDSKSEELPLLRHVYETYHKYKQEGSQKEYGRNAAMPK